MVTLIGTIIHFIPLLYLVTMRDFNIKQEGHISAQLQIWMQLTQYYKTNTPCAMFTTSPV